MASDIPRAVQRFLALPAEARRLGPYRLERQLGRGGFAPVWLARETCGDTTLRLAAVKLFALEAGRGGGAARQAFVDEAQRLCQVEHPNVVRFYAVQIDEARGVAGLAMEYVAGQTLAERLQKNGKLGVREAIEVGAAVASALAAVHAAALVHRDVSPANVVAGGAAGAVGAAYKLIDFGIAAASPAPAGAGAKQEAEAAFAADPGSAPSAAGGKLGYVDPRCWRELVPATGASDLYGLGAVLFVCLTGRIPAAASGALRAEVLEGTARAPRLCDVEPGAPPALGRLVDALLAPDPAERPPSAEGVAIELERLRAGADGRALSLPSEEEGPFRGLARFEEQHRDVFFGRGADVAAALEVLRSRGLVALVGPSGSGKSSLARAGVLPAVADGALGGPKVWEAAILTPGADPRGAIGAALVHMLDASRPPEEAAIAMASWLHGARRGLVLLVDQLEELATLARERDAYAESRRWTIALLTRLGERPLPNLRVVVTARRDMLDPILAHRDLGRVLMRAAVLVRPLQDTAWGEVVDAALERYGYRFEDDALREELLEALRGAADAMPLVQFALSRLWNERDAMRKLLTRAGLRAIGGVSGALDRYAEATFERAVAEGSAEPVLRRVLLSLTTPEGARVARPQAALMGLGGEHDEAARAAIEQLEGARLLVRERGGLTLAHEALLTQWGRLRSWLAEVRRDRLLAEQIEQAAKHWADERRDPDLLWRKRRLAAAEDLARRGGVPLGATEAAFLRACRVAKRRRRAAVAAAAALLAVAGVLFGGKYLSDKRAEERKLQAEKARAEQNALAAVAQKDLADRAMLQAEKARGDAERARREALDAARRYASDLSGFEKKLMAVRTERDRIELQEEVQARQEQAIEIELEEEPEALDGGAEAAGAGGGDDAGGAEATWFNRGAASSALQSAASKAAECRERPGPRGPGKARVTFDPEGTVRAVELDARFVGTEAGECVEAAFRKMRVPAFSGPPVVAPKSFHLP